MLLFWRSQFFFNDDFITSNEQRPTSIFTGSLTEDQIEQQRNITLDKTSNTSSNELPMETSNSFTTSAFLDLENSVYRDKWSIPIKREQNLGRCLLSATRLAVDGIADQDEHCKKFMEILIPAAFQKLQCSDLVNSWPAMVQLGVFDMMQLLVDLIAARLAYSPVPTQLLETLAILFDHDSVFQQKNKNRSYNGSHYDEQLGERLLAKSSSSRFSDSNKNEQYGWLREIINRFV
ncbi:unnamed protein product, partial [Rotaria magnacalcarata]